MVRTTKQAPKFKKVAEVVLAPLHMIDKSPHNPKHRTDDKEVKSLAESIKTYGQLVPVILFWNAKKDRLITNEGNRRVAARRLNGDEFVEAIIKDHAPPSEYAQINEEVKKHNQGEKLESFLLNPESVGPYFRVRFANMIRLIGRDTAQKMVQNGKGWAFFKNRASCYAKWVELPDRELKAFVNYLLDVTDAETNCRKLKEGNNLHGHHTLEGRILEIKKAFEQRRTPTCTFGGNRIEVLSKVAVN